MKWSEESFSASETVDYTIYGRALAAIMPTGKKMIIKASENTLENEVILDIK